MITIVELFEKIVFFFNSLAVIATFYLKKTLGLRRRVAHQIAICTLNERIKHFFQFKRNSQKLITIFFRKFKTLGQDRTQKLHFKIYK